MASSEPYFYDQSYANGKTLKTPIPVDEQGMHVIEREIWVREPRATPIPTSNEGVFLHRKWVKEIRKPNSRQDGSALQSESFLQQMTNSATLT